MFVFRETRDSEVDGHPAIDLAFTDRHLDLALPAPGDDAAACRAAENLRILARELAPTDVALPVVSLRQVHGAEVEVVDDAYDGRELFADGLVTTRSGVTLLVRAADCVPVLLADAGHRVVAAVHSGRPGLVAGVVPAAVRAMRALGATEISAWVGPHVCGRCYEVPAQMREAVSAAVPEAFAETSWGTPAVDIGAGVRAQLAADHVRVHDVGRCTREDADLWSYRRDGASAGRLGGTIGIRP